MAEWKISPELRAELEKLRLAEAVERIRVMVEVEPRILTIEAAAETLTVQYGAEVVYKSKVTNYISIIVDSDKVYDIAAQPWVKRVWHVPEVRLLDEEIRLPVLEEPVPEAVSLTLMETAEYIGVKRAKEMGYTGKGLVIAVVDTGIEKTHSMLIGKVIAEKNFTEGPDPGDRYGHGTWCASCALGNYWESPVGPLEGMAPGAMLINAKIFETGGTTNDIAMAGLEWAAEQGAHILSNSWGGARYGPMRDLIIALKEKYGAIFVFSAGNSGPDYETIGYPGGYPEVVGVGSVAVKNPAPDTVATFSSRGPNWQGDIKPDVMAPGGNVSPDECIYAAYIGGTVKCWRGTSMAAPHIAGGLALILEARATVEDLYGTARDIYASGKDNDSGWGVAQIDKACELGKISTVIEVNVEPPSYTRRLEAFPFEGRLLVKETAEPLPTRTVNLMVNKETVASTTTDAEGRWAFSVSLEEGEYKVTASFSGDEEYGSSTSRESTVTVGTTIMTVEKEPPHFTYPEGAFAFSGYLREITGAPLSNKTIELMVNDMAVDSTVTDTEGRWTFTVSIPEKGTFVLYARFTGDELYSKSSTGNYTITVDDAVLEIIDLATGQTVGVFPLTLCEAKVYELDVGSYRFNATYLKTGETLYEDREIIEGENPPLTFEFSPPQYSLTVQSSPITGVPVKVDGVPVGITPLTTTTLEGTRIVEVPEEFET
jgi:subtilisin family serine protease